MAGQIGEDGEIVVLCRAQAVHEDEGVLRLRVRGGRDVCVVQGMSVDGCKRHLCACDKLGLLTVVFWAFCVDLFPYSLLPFI